MSIVRITLKSVGYPKVAPNSTLVLQSLAKEGFKIVLRNVTYKNKEAIINYFSDHHLRVSFLSVKDPDIDILDDKAIIGVDTVEGDINSLWEKVDHICLANKIYNRNPLYEYIPSYEEGYFLVLDYGLNTQLIDSKPVSIKGAHTKGARVMNARPTINTIDVVDSTTLQIVEHFNKDVFAFEEATEEVYFSILV